MLSRLKHRCQPVKKCLPQGSGDWVRGQKQGLSCHKRLLPVMIRSWVTIVIGMYNRPNAGAVNLTLHM